MSRYVYIKQIYLTKYIFHFVNCLYKTLTFYSGYSINLKVLQSLGVYIDLDMYAMVNIILPIRISVSSYKCSLLDTLAFG